MNCLFGIVHKYLMYSRITLTYDINIHDINKYLWYFNDINKSVTIEYIIKYWLSIKKNYVSNTDDAGLGWFLFVVYVKY